MIRRRFRVITYANLRAIDRGWIKRGVNRG